MKMKSHLLSENDTLAFLNRALHFYEDIAGCDQL